MENTLSGKFLTAQLGSLLTCLDKAASGSGVTQRDLEVMLHLHTVLKDCVVLQKNAKLQSLKPELLGKIEGFISGSDYTKIKAVLDSVHAGYSISRDRVALISGSRDITGRIHIGTAKNNIAAIVENLQVRLQGNPEGEGTIPDVILYSIEAACEVVRLIIEQCHEDIRKTNRK